MPQDILTYLHPPHSQIQVQKMEYEDVKDAPADGIYVHGLYLEGCSWSKKEAHITEAARGELVCVRSIISNKMV